MHSVYKLIDPRDELPFYVGITDNPGTRLKAHLGDTANREKQRRIQSIHNDGLEPGMEIIETWEDRALARARERYWVLAFIDWGIPLTNIDYTEAFVPKTAREPVEKVVHLPFSHFLDERTAGISPEYCAVRGLKAIGWLQYFEINDAWYTYQSNLHIHIETMQDLDHFIATFIPPARIPVMREKDKRRLGIWYDKKQWAIQYPSQIRPCTASI